MRNLILILDNIRSIHNVGSMFRTGDAAGVSKIYLCGTTPTPFDRFGRPRSDFAKVSLGAENTVAWHYFPTTNEATIHAREAGYSIVALEQNERSILYTEKMNEDMIALVVGNEVDGVASEILAIADRIIEIPMKGEKESLNVSVAAGIALFRLRDW